MGARSLRDQPQKNKGMNQAQNISVATFLASLCALSTALSQTVTRGPYLQLPKPNSVTVKWRTDLSTDSVVRYGTSVGIYPFTASSASPDTKHEISVGGLQPDTRYFYTVGNATGGLTGGDESFSFVTSPPDNVDTPTRIWVTGDAGTADANAVAVRDAYQTFTGTGPAILTCS